MADLSPHPHPAPRASLTDCLDHLEAALNLLRVIRHGTLHANPEAAVVAWRCLRDRVIQELEDFTPEVAAAANGGGGG